MDCSEAMSFRVPVQPSRRAERRLGGLTHRPAAGRFPLPTTEEWGEGKGEGIPISRANSMEGAPLPARASQGEGAGGFRDGSSIQMRPALISPGISCCHHVDPIYTRRVRLNWKFLWLAIIPLL